MGFERIQISDRLDLKRCGPLDKYFLLQEVKFKIS